MEPLIGTTSKPSSPPPLSFGGRETTVKKLRLSKALTIPEGTTRRVDAVLLTDSNALLSGIVTDKDISARVIAEGFSEDDPRLEKAAEQGGAIAATGVERQMGGNFSAPYAFLEL
ncbi:hypothetical protein ACFX2J_022897 [Malus domestica]